MKKLDICINRMSKLGINITLVGNYPWIYIDTINGKIVTEKFYAEHGFTIMLTPNLTGKGYEFTDIGEIFKLIRKYIK